MRAKVSAALVDLVDRLILATQEAILDPSPQEAQVAVEALTAMSEGVLRSTDILWGRRSGPVGSATKVEALRHNMRTLQTIYGPQAAP